MEVSRLLLCNSCDLVNYGRLVFAYMYIIQLNITCVVISSESVKKSLRRPRIRWKNGIKIDLNKTLPEIEKWLFLWGLQISCPFLAVHQVFHERHQFINKAFSRNALIIFFVNNHCGDVCIFVPFSIVVFLTITVEIFVLLSHFQFDLPNNQSFTLISSRVFNYFTILKQYLA